MSCLVDLKERRSPTPGFKAAHSSRDLTQAGWCPSLDELWRNSRPCPFDSLISFHKFSERMNHFLWSPSAAHDVSVGKTFTVTFLFDKCWWTSGLLIEESLWLWVRAGNGMFEKCHRGHRGRSKEVITEARLKDRWKVAKISGCCIGQGSPEK